MRFSGFAAVKRLLGRKSGRGRSRSAVARSARHPNRREVLGALGVLPVAGLLSCPASEEKAQDKPEQVDAVTQPTFVSRSDKQEYARLKDLDLSDPEVVAEQKKMPVGRIGKLRVGRLISGSNLISMNMHARDLDYVRALAANYNTEERIFMTLKKCEERGVNTIVLKNHNFKQYRLSKYWDQWGGKMKDIMLAGEEADVGVHVRSWSG